MPIPNVGEGVPWFTARSPSLPDFAFSAAGGRHVVLCFVGSAGPEPVRAMLAKLHRRQDLFDHRLASMLVVSSDRADERLKRLDDAPGLHVFWDDEGKVAELYGLAARSEDRLALTPTTFLLDPLLRVMAVLPLRDPDRHADEILALLDKLPKERTNGPGAPVLVLPRIFEPEFCRHLIDQFDLEASIVSGFMRNDPLTGQTVVMHNPDLKIRRDCQIEDPQLLRMIHARLSARLVPEIKKAFQFQVTRIERHTIARYDAAEGGHFSAHRDNTTKGTAHRRFAVTLNLNAEEYEGGDLTFPEFGARRYRAPTGGAVVFSCSLLHQAEPVTQGVRYCFLPFLYDDAAAKIRAENLDFVDLAQR